MFLNCSFICHKLVEGYMPAHFVQDKNTAGKLFIPMNYFELQFLGDVIGNMKGRLLSLVAV